MRHSATRSLKFRVLIAFSASALALPIVGGITSHYLASASETFRRLVEWNVPNLREINAMNLAGKDIEVQAESLLGSQNTLEQADSAIKDAKKAISDFDQAAKTYEGIPFQPGEEAIWERFKSEAWKPFVAVSFKILEMSKTTDVAQSKKRDAIGDTEYAAARTKVNQGFEEMRKFQTSGIETGSATALGAVRQLRVILWALIGAGIVVSLLIGFFTSRALSLTLNTLSERLSAGSESVASASRLISETGSTLSSSTTEQAAALQETVASVDEISAMVAKNADNAKKSQGIAAQSNQAATRGKETVQEMIGAIGEISRANDEITAQIEASNREISDIVKVIAEIGNKTKVINDIVFQTKLLSFNASVEAARAGDQGKGFAVVAEEVGNLAQMSGNAAKEITQMLDASIEKVEAIVNATRSKVEGLVTRGKTKVQAGTETAKRCGKVLDEIVENVSHVTQMIDEIASASQEQSQGVHEITKAMSQLDQVTQENAASAQKSANASEDLAKQASELKGIVSALERTVRGGETKASDQMQVPQASVGNVVPLRPLRPRAAHGAPVAKARPEAVGSSHHPSEDDPRFKDA